MGLITCNKLTKETAINSNRTILITGASSGIGEALAKRYARTGVSLYLCGRNSHRLNSVSNDCCALGATVDAELLDVTDRTGMVSWINKCDKNTPLDLVIANAGISVGDPKIGNGLSATRGIFSVNIDGVVNTVLPALDKMYKRKFGQIAIISSLAAFRGLPGSPAYCASKATVKSWGEGLRVRYASEGVRISVICPGFVVSRMTAHNHFHMPFLMNAERAAAIIERGLEKNRGRIAFPLPMYTASWLLQMLPISITDRITRNLPTKE